MWTLGEIALTVNYPPLLLEVNRGVTPRMGVETSFMHVQVKYSTC